MKKIVALIAAAMMVFAFVGCGSAEEEEPATEETTTVAEETTEAATDDIGIDKATEIALADAGFSKGDVEFTKQQADVDDGVNIYEVDFTQGETKYEYDIDAATGKILERDTDSIYDD